MIPQLLLVVSLVAGQCWSGYLTRHDAIESVFDHFPERRKPYVDGYIGVKNLDQLGRYYLLTANNKTVIVYAADKLNEDHREAHNALWGDTWAADVDKDLLASLNNDNWGTLCKTNKPQRINQSPYSLKKIME